MRKTKAKKPAKKIAAKKSLPRFSDVKTAEACIEAGIEAAVKLMNSRTRPALPVHAWQAVVYALGMHSVRSFNRAEKLLDIPKRGPKPNLYDTNHLFEEGQKAEKRRLLVLAMKKKA